MPIVFKGGMPKTGRSGAADKEFTFNFPDPTAPPTPPPPSFGGETTTPKFEFTFDGPSIAQIRTASSSPDGFKRPYLDPSPVITPKQQPVVQTMPTKEHQEKPQPKLPPKLQLEPQPKPQQPQHAAVPAKHRRRTHLACTHTKMVRVYSVGMRCDICQRHGPFGWLYRCTEDREELLRHAISAGNTEVSNFCFWPQNERLPSGLTPQAYHFDELGRRLSMLVKTSPRSAESRADIFSFFSELDEDQMKTYSPEQVALILRQRENVRKVCREEMVKFTETMTSERNNPTWQELLRTKPWVVKSVRECQHKVCPYCRPNGVDRVYVSLDGVANGDVPATAVTGFGFHVFNKRPVCDANVVARVGLRKVPEVCRRDLLTMIVLTVGSLSRHRLPRRKSRPTTMIPKLRHHHPKPIRPP